MPVPSVISEGNAKGAARTHAHTQKRARRQNRTVLPWPAQLLRGPLEPHPGPTHTPYSHEAASNHDHKGQLYISALFPCRTQGRNCPHFNKVTFRTKELTHD